ncbi:MAG: hypothetical protein JST55_16550 [Bacteroidetes bacterium]|nr:hypothetical protein [Bacteroidota bacterium]
MKNVNNKKLYNLFLILSVVCVFFIISGCGSKLPPIDQAKLTDLQSKYIHPITTDSVDKRIDVYIDYSSGMYEAIKSNEPFMNELLRMVNFPSTKYYKVGASSPAEVDITTAPYVPWNLSNYKDQMSKLDEPINQIIENKKNSSVFITDFELVKNPEKILEITQNGKIFKSQIDISPWAITQFESWLSDGNEIDIYAKKFSRDNFWVSPKEKQEQYVYTILFTPKGLTNTKDNSSLQSRMYESNFKNIPDDFYHFSFATEEYNIKQENYNKENGGLTSSLAPTQFFNSFKNKYEYYELINKDLLDFITNEDQKDKRLIKGLLFENNMTNYPEAKLSLNVYDVTSTWSAFYQYTTQQPPEIEKNEETGEKKIVKNEPIKFDYQTSEVLNGMFDIVYNKENKQVGLKLSKDFVGVNNTTLFQVDIVVNKGNLFLDPDIEKVLQWRDSRGFDVTSLLSSIKEAMQRVTKKNNATAIYTYYILITK